MEVCDRRGRAQRRDVHRSRPRRPSAFTARRCRWTRRSFGEKRVGFYLRVPLGVVSAITPFNFPLNLVAHKVGPALAAGNTVVLKPAEETPLTAVRMAECFREAGLPDGVLEIVHGDGPTTGEALVRHPVPAKVSFTGSPPVGERILAIAGLKRVTLELGNNSGAIVEPDANLDVAVPRTVMSAFVELRSGLPQSAAALRPGGDLRRRSWGASSLRPTP